MPKNSYLQSDFNLHFRSSDETSLGLGKDHRRESRRKTDELFRLLVDSMNEAVFVIKRDGRIRYVNKASLGLDRHHRS